MALKSSREGLRKELVDYLGNLIIDDNLRNEIIKIIDDNFVTNESLNEAVNNLTRQIITESGVRIEADDTLQNNINAETRAREQAISTLEETISNINPLIAYPIGSVYFSVNNTDPSTILGGGTWELIGSKLAVRENVVGNGYTLGFSDGTSFYGTAKNSNSMLPDLGAYGKSYTDNPTGTTSVTTNIGVPPKFKLGDNPQYSGLIVDTETIYSWKRVA